MDEKSFERLLLRVRNDRGLDLSGYKDTFVLRRLRSRFRALGIQSIDEYTQILKKNPEEYEKLIEALAINVTEFFRDPSLFELLSKKIIPEVLRDKGIGTGVSLRFLCAGGASGEEAYSIAITISETLGDQLGKHTVTILSVDIDEDCLRKAKEGVYHRDRLRNIPPGLLAKYFEREGDSYKVCPALRRMVRFGRLDILTERLPRCFDVILCRNVLIYFSKDAHEDLFQKMHACVARRGFLILGRTETLMRSSKELFETYDAKERVYRRIVLKW